MALLGAMRFFLEARPAFLYAPSFHRAPLSLSLHWEQDVILTAGWWVPHHAHALEYRKAKETVVHRIPEAPCRFVMLLCCKCEDRFVTSTAIGIGSDHGPYQLSGTEGLHTTWQS